MLYNTDKIKVVLVDDDQDDIHLFQEAFSSVKVKSKLSFFKDGSEAMDYFSKSENEILHILFLDLNMPKMGGIEVLTKLRQMERYKELPIAIYSTSSNEDDIEATLGLGANIYIVKPNDFEKLKKALSEILKIQWQYENDKLDLKNYLMVFD